MEVSLCRGMFRGAGHTDYTASTVFRFYLFKHLGVSPRIHLMQFNARGGSSLQACLQLLLDNTNLNNRRSPEAQPLQQERSFFVQEEDGPHPKGHVPAAKIRSKKLKASLNRESLPHLMMALASAAAAITLK